MLSMTDMYFVMSYLHNLRQGDIIEPVIVQLETAKPFFQLCTYLHITYYGKSLLTTHNLKNEIKGDNGVWKQSLPYEVILC